MGSIHLSDPPPDIYFPLNVDVPERLLPKSLLPQRPSTSCDGARSRSLREDAVDAGFTHLVVAFWVHQEAHVRVQVTGRFAYWANVWRRRSRVSRGLRGRCGKAKGVELGVELTILFAWTARHTVALSGARHGEIREPLCGRRTFEERCIASHISQG